jgi:hypothetical protein
VVKLGLPPNSTQSVLPKIKSVNEQSPSPTKGTLRPRKRGDDGTTPSGGGFPEMASPGLGDGGSGSGSGGRSAGVGSGPGVGTVIDIDGNVQNVTYAVAIYP